MRLTRRQFIGATSGATALGTFAERARGAAQAPSAFNPRADFPAVSDYAFLNTAYIGLIARPVVEAGRAWLDARAHRPLEVGEMLAKADEVRHRFAGLINATLAGNSFGLQLQSGGTVTNLQVDNKDPAGAQSDSVLGGVGFFFTLSRGRHETGDVAPMTKFGSLTAQFNLTTTQTGNLHEHIASKRKGL
jgi:hypothetical protein